jgi:hypothetical protein
MTSSRRTTFLFFVLLILGAFGLPIACSAGTNNPAPAVTYVRPDTGNPLPPPDTGHDTAPIVVDTGPPDTGSPDTFEAAVDACETSTADGGPVFVGPAVLTFGTSMGYVNCGTQASPQTISITNGTCQPFNWQGTLSTGGSAYTLSPSSGMALAPGATQVIQVVPAPIPTTSAVTQDLYAGNITITTTSPNDTGHIIELHETAYGVILTSTLGSSYGFGGVSIGQTATNQFSLVNNGNAPTTVGLAVGSMFFGVNPPGAPMGTTPQMMTSVSVMANSSAAPTVAFSPKAVQSYTDTLILSVPAGTPLCGALPANTALTGAGTTGIAVMPTNLDFGTVPCTPSAQAGLQTITITNTGAPATYTPSFALGPTSPYTLAAYQAATPTVPGASIPAGTGTSYPLPTGSLTIDIVPNPIPHPALTAANGYGDTLTITTTGMGDQPHNIALHETAQGAIYTLSPMTISIGETCLTTQPACNTIFSTFQIGNSGNVTAGYDLVFAAAAGQSSVLSPPNSLTAGMGGPTFAMSLSSGTLASGVTEMGTLSTIPPPETAGMSCTGSCGGEAGTCTSPAVCMSGQCCTPNYTKYSTLSAIHLVPTLPDGGTPVLCADVPPDIQLQVGN